MSTNKTVNVTTGKVLHYTVSKQGYKPISGSKLITSNQTININMIPTTSPDGVYVFGDRIGGCATFFTYFDSVNPDTHITQKYAVFVLDAEYRKGNENYTYWGEGNTDTLLPDYGSAQLAIDSKESATYNTQTIFDNYIVGPGQSNYAAFYYARNPNGQSLIINVGGNNYSPQLLNLYELDKLRTFKSQLDEIDPTASTYNTKTLSYLFTTTNYQTIWCSNEYNSQYSFMWNYDNTYGAGIKSGNRWVLPVFEIPVN